MKPVETGKADIAFSLMISAYFSQLISTFIDIFFCKQYTKCDLFIQ